MNRGVYRGVFSALVDDPDFQRLPPNARLLLLSLRLCPAAGPACIFRYYPEVLMRQTGLTKVELEKAFKTLETPPLVQAPWVIREGVVVWIRNGLRHDPYIRLSDDKHRKSVLKQVSGLPKLNIVLSFCDYYGFGRPFEDPSKGLGRPFPSETEYRVPSTDSPLSPPEGGADGFAEFYELFPRKVAPRTAKRAWRAAIKRADTETILAGLRHQLPALAQRRKDRIPYPATWLNGDSWLNDLNGEGETNPYQDWPQLFDCATCGEAHETRICPHRGAT